MQADPVPDIALDLRRDGLCVLPSLFDDELIIRAHRVAAALNFVQDDMGAKLVFYDADHVEEFAFFFQSQVFVKLFHGMLGPAAASRGNFVQLRTDRAALSATHRFHMDAVLPRYKVFLYLTDVSEEDGPLEYLRGTHVGDWRDPYREEIRDAMHGTTKADPDGIDYHGCLRTEAEIAAVTTRFQLRRVVGPRGTGVIFDTCGFHRAAPLRSGTRLILSMDWTRAQEYW